MHSVIREVSAAILIDTNGRVLLQRRDDKPGIVQPGKIGLFGGHREDNESFVDCVVREIAEEITCRIPIERFQHLLSFDGLDPDNFEGRVRGEFFVAYGIPTDQLIITEGKLLVVEPGDLSALRSELTPLTIIALDAFSAKPDAARFATPGDGGGGYVRSV